MRQMRQMEKKVGIESERERTNSVLTTEICTMNMNTEILSPCTHAYTYMHTHRHTHIHTANTNPDVNRVFRTRDPNLRVISKWDIGSGPGGNANAQGERVTSILNPNCTLGLPTR